MTAGRCGVTCHHPPPPTPLYSLPRPPQNVPSSQRSHFLLVLPTSPDKKSFPNGGPSSQCPVSP